MNDLKSQVVLVDALFTNFLLSMKEHMENRKGSENTYFTKNYMNKNCGKVALKRKITLIRQELLNLEKLIDKEVV